jgi:hypothetical protein
VRSGQVIVTAGLIAAATVAWHWIWLWYGELVTGWGGYSSELEWLDQAMLLLWALLLALGTALGILVAVLTRSNQPLLIALISGVVLGLALLLPAENHFTEHATLSTYVWTYGLYLMAPVGSLLGASIAVLAKRVLERPTAV